MDHPSLSSSSSFRLFLFINLFVFFYSTSPSAAADAAADPSAKFVECLSKQPPPPGGGMPAVYSQKNSSFGSVLVNYIRNRRFINAKTRKPVVIVTPLNVAHIQSSVICAAAVGIQVKVRSGGHDYDGISYTSSSPNPFLILDMFNLRSITVDTKTDTAWVQTGAILGEVYYQIAKASKVRAYPAGVCPTVGVGGHVSGAGYGNLLRKYGLTVDNVVDAQIVDVNGKLLDRKGMGEGLFWAIRGGGGGSFGVVVAYKIQLVAVPETVTVFRVERTQAQNAAEIVHKWQSVADKIDNNLFVRMLLQIQTVKPDPKKDSFKTIKATWIALYLGNTKGLMQVVGKSFPELGLKPEDCKEMSWINSVLYWANFDNKTKPEVLLNRTGGNFNFEKRKSDYLQTPIPKAGLESLFKKMIELGHTGLVFNPYGGKMSEIPATATPFPHRAGNIFKIQYSTNWKEEASEKEYMTSIRGLYEFMTPFVSKNPRGAYLNYRDIDIGVTDNGKDALAQGKVYGSKYWMGNFDRLVKVKTAVDPKNFFRNEQSVPPMSAAAKPRAF